MAIQYSISQTAPLVFPITTVNLAVIADGTSTTLTIPFSQYPFNMSVNQENKPSSIVVSGGTVTGGSIDPETLVATINFSGTTTGEALEIQIFYAG